MKVQLIKDERYPTYYADEMDGTYPPWGLGVEWPPQLDYEIYVASCKEYQSWQDKLALLYKEAEYQLDRRISWSTTNSPSVTTTSSTPTS